MTSTGKTRLAKLIASKYQSSGYTVLVCDPNFGKWGNAEVFTDINDFIDEAMANRQCILFVDEAGETMDKFDSAHNWLATRSRHWGHRVYFISQDALQVSRLVRDQCSELFAFAQSTKASSILADEYNQPQLKTLADLKRGDFIYCKRMEKPELCHLDVISGKITKKHLTKEMPHVTHTVSDSGSDHRHSVADEGIATEGNQESQTKGK